MINYLAKHRAILTLTGILALGSASITLTNSANAADNYCGKGQEKCYGVSKASQDDGNQETNIPGMSIVDFDGSAFKCVTKKTCEETSTPFGYGSLKPLSNRPPKG